MQENDSAGTNRAPDPFDNFLRVVALGIKGARAPRNESQTSRCENRVQERILETGWCAEPDRRVQTEGCQGRLKPIDFPGNRGRSEAPETECRMCLCMIPDRMPGIKDHLSEFGILCRFCSDQEKCGASPILFQER